MLMAAGTCLLLASCSENPTLVGGSGHEGEEFTVAVSGSARYADGVPAAEIHY
jgi:hypothetical protein